MMKTSMRDLWGHFFSTFLDFKFGLKIELIKCAIFGSDKTAKSDFFLSLLKSILVNH